MFTVCRIVVMGFAVLWLLALGVLAIGTFGLLGQTQDPLSGIYLIPLGLPWNLLLDDLPDPASLLVGMLAPGVNLLLLAAICRRRSKSGPRP